MIIIFTLKTNIDISTGLLKWLIHILMVSLLKVELRRICDVIYETWVNELIKICIITQMRVLNIIGGNHLYFIIISGYRHWSA